MTTPSTDNSTMTKVESSPIMNNTLSKSPSSSPFRPISLPLFNPGLSGPSSPLLTASAFAALSGSAPGSPNTSMDNFTTQQPTIQRRPSKKDRVARATREFRDTWIVPE